MTAAKSSSIDPKELIKTTSIEEFNHYSDLYYQRLPLPEFQMGKPFSMVGEAGEHMRLIGMMLNALEMKPGLRTLDFGAGTCWLTKMIWQMGCPVYALDVSKEALRLGEQLFKEYSVPYDPKVGYEFQLFDGERIDLPNESIDRIVCYEVFHHVPNIEAVFSEFYRVLAPGGKIGFNEPLGNHSQSAESQYEMRTYKVLENDLHIDELVDLAKSLGFSEPSYQAFALPELKLTHEQRRGICAGEDFPDAVLDSIRDSMRTSGIFTFSKGEALGDSRSPEGLACRIEVHADSLRFPRNTHAYVEVTVVNTGSVKWLTGKGPEIGTVNIGTQLFDTDGNALQVDLTRGNLPRDLDPGESAKATVPLVVMEAGRYRIGFDLVSELVTWFHIQGSEMQFVEVEVY